MPGRPPLAADAACGPERAVSRPGLLSGEAGAHGQAAVCGAFGHQQPTHAGCDSRSSWERGQPSRDGSQLSCEEHAAEPIGAHGAEPGDRGGQRSTARPGGQPPGQPARDGDASALFSDLDKLILDYAAGMSRTPVEVPDELFARLRAHFDEAQLVELTHVIALENLRGRFNLAFGIGAAGFSEGMVCAAPTTAPLPRMEGRHPASADRRATFTGSARASGSE